MKAFISIDMEGICGVVREIETHPTKGGEAYQQSRRLMTQEGNAAIEGCLKAGATEVLIADSHWNFDNLIPGRAARGGDAPSRNSTRVRHDARPRWVLRRRAVRRISCKGGNTAGDPRSHVQRKDRRGPGEWHGGGGDRDQCIPRRPSWRSCGPRNGRLGRDRRGEGIESERAHGRGEGRDGGHVREESAPQEGPGTDSGRGHQGGPRGEDDPAPSSKDPRPNGCRVPRHLCS